MKVRLIVETGEQFFQEHQPDSDKEGKGRKHNNILFKDMDDILRKNVC